MAASSPFRPVAAGPRPPDFTASSADAGTPRVRRGVAPSDACMLIVIGLAIVLGSVLGGFLPHGDLRVLWQPLEVLIIVGAALGAFIIANPLPVQLGVLKNLKVLFKDAPHPKAAYLELLTLLYTVFRLARGKGMLALETHLEHPYQSELFGRFPHFVANH